MTLQSEQTHPQPAKLRAWLTLLAILFLVWGFAFGVGPWVQAHVPIIQQIFQTIDEGDINANAYFYTEIEASHEGERYLQETRRWSDPEHSGLTLSFLAGVLLCITILGIGFRYLPRD